MVLEGKVVEREIDMGGSNNKCCSGLVGERTRSRGKRKMQQLGKERSEGS